MTEHLLTWLTRCEAWSVRAVKAVFAGRTRALQRRVVRQIEARR